MSAPERHLKYCASTAQIYNSHTLGILWNAGQGDIGDMDNGFTTDRSLKRAVRTGCKRSAYKGIKLDGQTAGRRR